MTERQRKMAGRKAPGGDVANGRCLTIALKRAFPLPKSGAFKDILDAIDEAERLRCH